MALPPSGVGCGVAMVLEKHRSRRSLGLRRLLRFRNNVKKFHSIDK